MKLTCTRYTLLFRVRQTSNYRKRKNTTPPSRGLNTVRETIGYLMILKKPCLTNQPEQHTIRYLCLETRRLYNTTKNTDDNTANYLVRFQNTQKENEACNGSFISRRFQEHGTKILYPLHVTRFNVL